MTLNHFEAVALQRAVQAERYRRDFRSFVRRAWAEVDPAPLVWGPHMDALTVHLQAVAEGRVRRLLINIPPGHAKSMLVSVLWPVWLWCREPEKRIMTASYGLDLAMRDAVKSRDLMRSPWFMETFGEEWSLKDDQNVKSRYDNTAKGFRIALSVGSKATGFRGDCLVIDDALNASDAHSKTARDECVRWKTETMSSRFNNMATATEVVIMQRLHEDDLAGYLIKQGGWCHLSLATEFEPSRPCATYDDALQPLWKDWRTKEGELLFPEKFSEAVVKDIKSGRGMGSYAYAGQHQQRPSPAKGGMLKREWFSRRWEVLPKRFDKVIITADCTFKKTEDSDRVAIQVWGKLKNEAYLIDTKWERMGFSETLQSILALKLKWPDIGQVCIEDKANGSAIIEVLKERIPGVIAVQPEGGKEARVSAISPFLEAGNIILPRDATWVQDFIEECVAFPKGQHDDAVDAMSYAVFRLLQRTSFWEMEALGKL